MECLRGQIPSSIRKNSPVRYSFGKNYKQCDHYTLFDGILILTFSLMYPLLFVCPKKKKNTAQAMWASCGTIHQLG